MILFSYLIKELIFPFFLSMGILSAILMMDQIFKFIPFLKATGLEFSVLFEMILYSMPMILMIAAPISLMIGTYIGAHRFSADHEIIAMRASGVSLSFMFKPMIFLSLAVSLFVMLQAFYWSPICTMKIDELKFNIMKRKAKINLSEKKINNFFNQQLIYIFEKEKELLKGIVIANWKKPESSPVIEAKQGKFLFDEEERNMLFQLENGKIHTDRGDDKYQVIAFQKLDYNISPPSPEGKNIPQRFYKSRNLASRPDTGLTITELMEVMEDPETDRDSYYEYLDEFHGRIVTVLSCISFAFFALPMGIFNPRNPKSGKFIYMILMLVVYFIIFAHARSLLVNGKASPALVYLPLILSLIIGLVNFVKINYDLASLLELLHLHRKDEDSENPSMKQNLNKRKS